MRRSLIAVLFLAIWGLSAASMVTPRDVEQASYEFVDSAPAGLRNYYLDGLLGTQDDNCWKCGFRLAGALDAIQDDLLTRNNSYNFDYARLLPFLGSVKFGEAISATACNAILLSRSDRVYFAMIKKYRNDIDTLSDCAWGGLERVHRVWPTYYPDVKQKLWHDLRTAGLGDAKDSWGNSLLSDYNCPYIPNNAGCPKH